MNDNQQRPENKLSSDAIKDLIGHLRLTHFSLTLSSVILLVSMRTIVTSKAEAAHREIQLIHGKVLPLLQPSSLRNRIGSEYAKLVGKQGDVNDLLRTSTRTYLCSFDSFVTGRVSSVTLPGVSIDPEHEKAAEGTSLPAWNALSVSTVSQLWNTLATDATIVVAPSTDSDVHESAFDSECVFGSLSGSREASGNWFAEWSDLGSNGLEFWLSNSKRETRREFKDEKVLEQLHSGETGETEPCSWMLRHIRGIVGGISPNGNVMVALPMNLFDRIVERKSTEDSEDRIILVDTLRGTEKRIGLMGVRSESADSEQHETSDTSESIIAPLREYELRYRWLRGVAVSDDGGKSLAMEFSDDQPAPWGDSRIVVLQSSGDNYAVERSVAARWPFTLIQENGGNVLYATSLDGSHLIHCKCDAISDNCSTSLGSIPDCLIEDFAFVNEDGQLIVAARHQYQPNTLSIVSCDLGSANVFEVAKLCGTHVKAMATSANGAYAVVVFEVMENSDKQVVHEKRDESEEVKANEFNRCAIIELFGDHKMHRMDLPPKVEVLSAGLSQDGERVGLLRNDRFEIYKWREDWRSNGVGGSNTTACNVAGIVRVSDFDDRFRLLIVPEECKEHGDLRAATRLSGGGTDPALSWRARSPPRNLWEKLLGGEEVRTMHAIVVTGVEPEAESSSVFPRFEVWGQASQFNFQASIIDQVRQETSSDLYIGAFSKTFSALSEFVSGHEQDSMASMETSLEFAAKHSDTKVEVIGISIPAESLGRWGVVIILGIQLYLLQHLRTGEVIPVADLRSVRSMWIGLYSGRIVEWILVASMFVLPVVTSYVVRTSVPGRQDVEWWCELLVATGGSVAMGYRSCLIMRKVRRTLYRTIVDPGRWNGA